MYYTARFAHLKYIPKFFPGEFICQGKIIGTMGSSGQSKHNHLHLDVVHGCINRIVRLKDIGYEDKHLYTPNIEQLNLFADKTLFGIELIITTYYYEPAYKMQFGKDHPAYDLVPYDRHTSTEHFDIHWNRSKVGKVLNVGFDDVGYGNYILIGFEA